ncbi:hypothetical protein [Arthrobacter sp. A5]|uniref:hypothetical protein n=1 Tax=Arthrobacter sp. A5 TaxID=576926 RepID=UPI003DA8B214
MKVAIQCCFPVHRRRQPASSSATIRAGTARLISMTSVNAMERFLPRDADDGRPFVE